MIFGKQNITEITRKRKTNINLSFKDFSTYRLSSLAKKYTKIIIIHTFCQEKSDTFPDDEDAKI